MIDNCPTTSATITTITRGVTAADVTAATVAGAGATAVAAANITAAGAAAVVDVDVGVLVVFILDLHSAGRFPDLVFSLAAGWRHSVGRSEALVKMPSLLFQIASPRLF